MEFNKPAPLKMTGELSQNFKFFKQQIEIYMTATETDEKSKTIQVAILLNLMGTDALKVYNTLVMDEPDTEVSQILGRLEKYFSPRTNEIMSHYKFFTSKQNDENFDVYLTRLKELVKPCNFGTLENKLLKTQIVLGIRCRDTLEWLLREDMTLDQVVAFCQSAEVVDENFKETPAAVSKQKTTINDCARSGVMENMYNSDSLSSASASPPHMPAHSQPLQNATTAATTATVPFMPYYMNQVGNRGPTFNSPIHHHLNYSPIYGYDGLHQKKSNTGIATGHRIATGTSYQHQYYHDVHYPSTIPGAQRTSHTHLQDFLNM